MYAIGFLFNRESRIKINKESTKIENKMQRLTKIKV